MVFKNNTFTQQFLKLRLLSQASLQNNVKAETKDGEAHSWLSFHQQFLCLDSHPAFPRHSL